MTSDVRELLERGQSIAVAESLTGGLLASLLVEQAGISAIFRGGVVAYTAQAKAEVLGVEPHLISDHGVVSARVAVAMAEGAARMFHADLAVATTGVAGPGPDGGVPEGTVWIGRSDGVACRFLFSGDRSHIRRSAALSGISYLLDPHDIAEKSPFVTELWEKPDKGIA